MTAGSSRAAQYWVLAWAALAVLPALLYGAWRIDGMARWISATSAVCAGAPEYGQLTGAREVPQLVLIEDSRPGVASPPRLYCAQYALAPTPIIPRFRARDLSRVGYLIDVSDAARRETIVAKLAERVRADGREPQIQRSAAGPVLVWGRGG